MPKLEIPAQARTRISTKVAFQYSVMPTDVLDGAVQVAVSNPFDTAMLNSVRFDARGPVQFALATKPEIEKALTPKTKAIMPVHIYGHPCDMDPLMALAKKH